VREIAGTALTAGGFVVVKGDKGLAARFSAWVLVGAILHLMVQARAHRTMWPNLAREGDCPVFKIDFVPSL